MKDAAACDGAKMVVSSSHAVLLPVPRVVHLSLCLLLILLLLPSASLGQQIVSISGCTNVYPVTVNCSWSSVLRLVTRGLTAPPSPRVPCSVLISGNGPDVSCQAALDPSDRSNSSYFAFLSQCGYSYLLQRGLGRLLNVTLMVQTVSTAPFLGFSLTYQPPPALLSVSGCQNGSGLLCDPERSMLRISGSSLGFYLYQWGLQLRLEPAWPLPSAPPPVRVYIQPGSLNDSLLVLNLSYTKLSNALQPAHYGGVPLLLSLCVSCLPDDDWQSSHALPVSFVPLPPPRIESISSWNCNLDWQQAPSDCRPELSTLIVSGSFMYANVTEFWIGSDSAGVGFTPCQPLKLWLSPTFTVELPLPLLPHYEPGAWYDLRVRMGEQVTIARRVFAFTAAPTIDAISRCIVTGDPRTDIGGGYCQPGQWITITGSLFRADSSLQVNISLNVYGGYATASVLCLQPQRINSSCIVCLLPAPPAPTFYYSTFVTVRLQYGDGSRSNSSNPLTLMLYIAPSAPRITQITGCGRSVQPLQLELCRLNDVLTVSGVNLLGAVNYSRPNVYGPPPSSLYYQVLPGFTNVSFHCRLTGWNAAPLPGQPYVISTALQTTDWGYLMADAFTVSFLLDQQPAASGTSTGFVVGLLLVTLGATTMLLLLLLLARRAARQQSNAVTVVSSPAAAAAALAAGLSGEGELVSASPAARSLRAYSSQSSAARQQRGELAESLLPRPAMRIRV